jgi:hypothetical protein
LTGDYREIDHFRFYFDGLISHFYIDPEPEHIRAQDGIFIGPSDKMAVTTVRSENSLQMRMLAKTWREHDLAMDAKLKTPDV